MPGHGAGPDRSVVADPSGATYDGPFPVAPEGIPATLDKLLEGTVTHPQSQHSHPADPDGWQSGAVDLDGTTVTIAFQHSTGPRCDGDARLGSCTAVDSGFLGTYAAKVYSQGVGDTGVRDAGVTFYTPHGYKVSATASNAGSAAPTTPAMDDPVLDLAALTALAQNPAWR